MLAINLFFCLKSKSFINIFTEYISYVIIFMLKNKNKNFKLVLLTMGY